MGLFAIDVGTEERALLVDAHAVQSGGLKLDTAGLTATLRPSCGLAILLVVSGTASVEQSDEDDGESAVAGPTHALTPGSVRLVCPHTILKITSSSPDCLLFLASAKDIESEIATALDNAWEASIA